MAHNSQSGIFAMNVRTPRPREPWEANLSQIQMNNLELYRSQRNRNMINRNNRNGNNKGTIGTAASIAEGLRINRAQVNNVQLTVIVDGKEQTITVLEGDGLLNSLVEKGIIQDRTKYNATVTLEHKVTHEIKKDTVNIITTLLDLSGKYEEDIENFNVILILTKKGMMNSVRSGWQSFTKRFFGGKKRGNRRRKTSKKRKTHKNR